MLVEDFLKAIDTIKNPSKNFIVVFTGGEPLLREDIELCGRELRKRRLKCIRPSKPIFRCMI